MPTYEYQCSNCGNLWEELQKISEPALDTCPKCQEKAAHRLISGGNFILKGGGWYADAYSSSGNKKSEKSEKTDGKSDGAADTKSETKSENKSEGSKSESAAPAAAASGASTPKT